MLVPMVEVQRVVHPTVHLVALVALVASLVVVGLNLLVVPLTVEVQQVVFLVDSVASLKVASLKEE